MFESEFREAFNASFSSDTYERFVNDIQKSGRHALGFRVCETPFFPSKQLSQLLIDAANEIVLSLLSTELWNKIDQALPSHLAVPNEDAHPQFLQIDFAICKSPDGYAIPQLIELQGFPTVFAFQALIDEKVRSHFQLPDNLTAYFNGYTRNTYLSQFKQLLLGDADPDNVILLEIEPDKQKTRIDFYLTEDYTNISTVCLTKVKKRGRKLYYQKNGREILIERIYNRVIFDELQEKNVSFDFKFQDDLDVKWINHPNWFMKLSKYCLPLISSPFAPKSYFLSDLSSYPKDLENYVAKPLFSFSGGGVIIDVTKEALDAVADKSNYLLQRKVNYEPAIITPEGGTKVEVRMMFFWPEKDQKPTLVNNLVRMSRGILINTMYNKIQAWTGSNIAYHE